MTDLESGDSVTRFSIVVPAYNAEATLPETLDAILAQEFDDWECIVVDDGSADATQDIVRAYATRDARVRLVAQLNRGTAGAYNAGVAAAKGGLIVVCSADDILLPAHLGVMASLADRDPEHGIYSSNGDWLEPSGARRHFYHEPEWARERSLSFEDLLDRCFFGVGATYGRQVFDLVGGYREGVYGEDYDFWLRAMARGVTHRYTPEVLALHRLSASQKTSDLARVYESDIATYRNLIEAGWVQGERVAAVERAITEKQTVLRRNRLLARARGLLTRFVGRHAAEGLVESALALRRRVRAMVGGRAG